LRRAGSITKGDPVKSRQRISAEVLEAIMMML